MQVRSHAAASRAVSPAAGASSSVHHAAATRSASTHQAKAKAGKPGAKEAKADKPEEILEPAELARYRLQAVYPVVGTDARAWVLDNGTVRVVARGDLLGDARVQIIERDKVVTSKGIIR
jgi:hypothetical protein